MKGPEQARTRLQGMRRPCQSNRSPIGRCKFRYGVVFLLTLALVVFVVAAPSANWSRAVALAIGAALVVAVATARERKEVRF